MQTLIFIVDDMASNLAQAKEVLQGSYTVMTFSSAEVMFKALKKKRPVLILLDVEMPEMDGFGAIALLKADVRYANIPVIFLTAQTTPEIEKRGYELGALDFITKPFTSEGLLQRVKTQIEVSGLLLELLENSPMLVEIWDSSLNFVGCNQKMLEMFELNSQEEYIQRYDEFLPMFQPCGRTSVELGAEHSQTVLREGQTRYEWLRFLPNGEHLPCEVVAFRVEREGRQLIISYSHDLRSVKAAMERERELIEESNQAKNRFLARMSHEIRTPISAVLGIAEIQLQNPKIQPEIEEAFAKIHNSSQLLLGIVNDILDLSRIESGKMDLLYEKYPLADLIANVSHLHVANFGTKSIKFNLSVDENLPAFLMGDELRLEQIINNLLSNAFKYTDFGSVDLGFSREFHPEEEYVTLAVSINDTGFGMSEEQLDALHKYKEYTRFHEEEHRTISGTGLGMPIVYSLLELMDATIVINSEVGKGTNMLVRIPQKATNSELLGKTTAKSLEQFKTTDVQAKKLTFAPEPMPYGAVLVVDDVDANLYVAKGLLSYYELEVETCSSGAAALEKITAGKTYDIIFMDHMMPVMDGIETLQKIRALGYTQPIIVLTANAMIGKAEEFIRSGFDGFISKPINTGHLNAILHKHIKNKYHPDAAPENIAPTDTTNNLDYLNDPAIAEMLRFEFVNEQQLAFAGITQALDKNDTKTAHRLVHTLKGMAKLIFQHNLADYAEEVERPLAKDEFPTEEHLLALGIELRRVLEDIGRDAALY